MKVTLIIQPQHTLDLPSALHNGCTMAMTVVRKQSRHWAHSLLQHTTSKEKLRPGQGIADKTD
eukprot:1159835-Pelagomonas_calceolata.AAC.4